MKNVQILRKSTVCM